MKNKKSLIFISAIMILIFHLWVPLFEKGILFEIEKYLKFICYIGVDIFFFISAYSLGSKEIKYKDFIKNRFVNIYLKFIIFLIIAAFYKEYDITKCVSILTGYELLIKGGGSFLWFIPAIMILYLLIPLYKKVDDKYKIITPLILFITWLLFSILISYYTKYNAIFIFTNRLPIFMIGYYFAKYKLFELLNKNKIVYYITAILLFILGTFISYYGYKTHIRFDYLYDMFYLVNIPLILGIILLVNKIPNNYIFNQFGSISLEMYGLQMIFGFKIVTDVFYKTNSPIITNIITFIIIVLMSFIFSKIFNKIFNKNKNILIFKK